MAISARVEGITVLPDRTVRLMLGQVGDDPPGQDTLIVINPPDPPENLRGLIDVQIWGGSDELFVGEKVIAERLGYTRIRLLAPGEDSFKPFSKPIPLPT